jgi:hypothetical protein
VNINLQAPNPAPWAGTADAGRIQVELFVPQSSSIVINADNYDITALGPFKSFRSSPCYGSLKIRDVHEGLEVHGRGRNINLAEINGEIVVRSNNADIKIDYLTAEEKPAVIRNENGNIIIRKLRGGVDIRCQYGKVRISDFESGPLKNSIIGVHSPIRMELGAFDPGAELVVNNSHDDVEVVVISDLDARILLEVDSPGEMHIRDIPVIPERITDELMEVIAGDGRASIKIGVEGGGSINIEGESD